MKILRVSLAAFVLAGGLFISLAQADVVLSTATVAPSSSTVLLTLPQSIQLALGGATDILKAKNNLDFTGTQLLQTYLQFLPDLQAHGTYAWQSGRTYLATTAPTSIDTTNRSIQYTLVSTLNLFNGFSDAGALGSGRQQHAAAALSLYRARQQIILDVTQAYLEVLLARDIVQFADSNFQSSKQRETLLAAQAEVGSKSLADLYRQQAQTSADELFLIQSQNRERDDFILLLRRLRVDLMKSYDIADVVLDTPTAQNLYPDSDEHKLLMEATSQRADLKAFRASADAAQWEVTVARSGYYPRFDLFAEMYGIGEQLDKQIVNGVNVLPLLTQPQQSFGKQLEDQTLYTAGLNVSWAIFSRYITQTAVSRAKQLSRDAEIDYEDLTLQVEGDVQQAVGDYQAALQQVDSARRGLKAAQESYDAVQERYKVGASSIVDLLTAQSALVQAQTSDALARIGFVLQEKTMENVLGRTNVSPANL